MRFVLLPILLLPVVVAAEPLPVFVSVAPIQTFVEKVGGRHVEVRTMVRPGYNPHTFDPSPQQISALAKAVLYVRVGVPFEDAWMDRLRSANPEMQVLDARNGLELRPMEPHGHDDKGDGDGLNPSYHGHDNDQHEDHHAHEADHSGDTRHHESDPHVWTSPLLVKHIAGAIRDQLAELDSANAADFARNHDAFARELDALDRDIRGLLDPLPNRKFMVFHPAWGYFADTYDLIQVPIEREGKEPGARALAALIDQARQEDIRVVFVQPQFDKRQAEQVARAIGGGVISVDPLAADYVDNLREVARQFAEALRP